MRGGDGNYNVFDQYFEKVSATNQIVVVLIIASYKY